MAARTEEDRTQCPGDQKVADAVDRPASPAALLLAHSPQALPISTPARPSKSSSAARPPAASTSTPAPWPGTMPRHIPGNPTIVVKNMPGASGARAGYHVAVAAPSNGLTIGAITPGAIVGPLLDDKAKTTFDPSKLIYLGTTNAGVGHLRHDEHVQRSRRSPTR